MPRLLLLRHAQAEASQPGQNDHIRELSSRGRADIKRIGAYLAHHGMIPDLALVSTATRTRQTWELIVQAFDNTPTVSFEARLYEAEPHSLLEVIKTAKANAGTVLVVGHNPSIHELATALVATGDVAARQRLMEGFPTSALAVIGFPPESWDRLHPSAGRLEHFITPQSLDVATE